ncbi:PAS domain S-box protein [Phenylobacterium sp. J426]|uniref:sensor histidine kinase n=1 Tax=Phenylobacterium sp. J426 TaxID=2898439 RepID=UPI0021510CEA|nr:PAS domain S-box protein [Phenylobacterium sp. J426]MCR5874866.1 PAS domain S-box protein [Phenylobacterium sp. J426]
MTEHSGDEGRAAAALAVSAELRRLFERAPALAVVLRGPEHIFDYANPGYRRLMGGRELEGRRLRDAVPELEGQGFIELLDQVYRTGRPFEGREIAIQLPRDDDGRLEDGYFDFVYQPIVDASGAVIGIFAQGSEITDRVLAERKLRASETRLAGMIAQATVGISQTDMAGRFLLVNDRLCEILGRSREQLLDLTMQQVTHPDDLPTNLLFFERLSETGEPFVIEKRYLRADGSSVWVRNHVSAQRDDAGSIQFVTAVIEDISEAKLAEARQRLLINELNHRVKNTLATVQSLAAQAGRAEDPRAGQAAFLDRLMALSRAHDVLTAEHWSGAELRPTVAAALEPFGADDPARFVLQGPSVRLAPQEALALSLALHELATNAVKHGALSAPAGRVHLSWSVVPRGAHEAFDRLNLVWAEHGGPRWRRPSRKASAPASCGDWPTNSAAPRRPAGAPKACAGTSRAD